LLAAAPGAEPVAVTVTRLNPLDVRLTVPATAPDMVDAVVVVHCDGEVMTDSTRLLQPAFPTETLRAFDGELHGGLKFGPGKKIDDVVLGWSRTNQFVTWPARLNEAATYEVTADYDAMEASAGNTFAVTLGSQALSGTVQSGTHQATVLDRVALKAGSFEIKVAPAQIKAGELMHFRSLVLKPVSE
jgi:hypothetical protein